MRIWLGFHTHQRPEVNGALPNELKQQPVHEKISKRQRPKKRGQTVSRVVSLVVAMFDPPLDSFEAFSDLVLHEVFESRGLRARTVGVPARSAAVTR